MTLVAPGAHVIGDVTFGENCTVWYNAVVRGDEQPIRIGSCTNIQDNAVIHVDPAHSCTIGNGVTIGHSAVVHGATIGDNTVIGMGACVLNGAHIGRDCIIGAGAVIPENKRVKDGTIMYGNPAKKLREMTEEDIEANRFNARNYMQLVHRQPVEWRELDET